MLESLLLLLNIVVAIFLIVIVLLQRSDGGMGSLGGGSDSMMSAESAGNAMSKATMVLGALFMGSSLVLAMLTVGGSKPVSVIDEAPTQQESMPIIPEELPEETPK